MVYVQKKTVEQFPSEIHGEYSKAKEKMEQLMDIYSNQLPQDCRLRYIIKKGPKVYEEVINQAESYKDAIITMSTHGASGFEEFFIGSNAFKIISATTCPVIALRKGGTPEDIRKIVLPINLLPETRQKVPMTCEIARLFGAEVHVVEIAQSKSIRTKQRLHAYSKQVSNILKGADLKVVNESHFGDNIADITVEYAKSIKADMISIITEQNSSITNLILGNHAQQILNKAEIPVLNITPREIQIKGTFSTFGG
jgi:nucleotide-binding universal stress UspA family protein